MNKSELLVPLFDFLEEVGVPHKLIGGNFWFPLAQILRKCQFRQPQDAPDVLSHIDTQKMLLGGKTQTCVSLWSFSHVVAPFCQAEVVHQYAADFYNAFVVGKTKGDDQVDRIMQEPGAQFVRTGKGLALALPQQSHAPKDLISLFIRTNPEWAADVKIDESDQRLTPPAMCAYLRFLSEMLPEGSYNAGAMEHMRAWAFDRVIDAGGDFRPLSEREKK